MPWRVAHAKQRFSAVLRAAGEEPQVILKRDRPVGAIVGPEIFKDFLNWSTQRSGSIGRAFQDLRRVCQQEEYAFEPGLGQGRSTAVESLGNGSV